MASLRRPRTTAAGETTYSVVFRSGGKQTSETFATESAAEDFRDLVNLMTKIHGPHAGPAKALAELNDQHAPGLTLDHLAERFFEWKAGDVEPRTIKDYRRDYRNHIKPTLGGRQAESVDELDVQALVDKLNRTLDPKTVADRHAILAGIYKYGSAKVRRMVTHNPCLETQLPKRKTKAVKGFSLAEWDAMHTWAQKHEKDADDLLLFLVSTGWRISECTALTVAAVEDYGDLEVNIDGGRFTIPDLYVSILGVHRRDQHDQIVYAEGKAKSKAGLRRINMLPDAAHMIRRRMTGKKPGDLLFTNPKGNQWRTTNLLEREFARILDGAGIAKVHGMGNHYFRHTHVAMLDRAKVSLVKTQRRIGHENISTTTGVYGGMIDNSLEPAELVRMNAMVARPTDASGEIVQGEVVVGQLGAGQPTTLA